MNLLLQKHFAILFLLSACLSSCLSSKSPSTENKMFTNAEINIDTFSEFPPEIEGCSCSFSNNENDFENGEYIYAGDYQGNAYISINGDMKRFSLSSSHKISEKHYIMTWTSDDFEATLDYKQVGQIEETWQQKGTMKIKSTSGKEVVKAFYGECGC